MNKSTINIYLKHKYFIKNTTLSILILALIYTFVTIDHLYKHLPFKNDIFYNTLHHKNI